MGIYSYVDPDGDGIMTYIDQQELYTSLNFSGDLGVSLSNYK